MALSKIKGTVIADNAINADRIADGTVVASDLLDNTITGAKLATDIAISTTGSVTANTFSGDGSSLTALNISTDSTPQLGGNLDLNSNDITGTGNINITGTGTFSGDLTVDTDTLYVDSTNNKVGIGTAFPNNYNLSANNLVVGSTTSGLNGITIVTSTSGSGSLHFADGATGNQSYQGRITYDHSLNSMGFNVNNGSERMRIDSSGRVGIATSTPTSTLDVNGNFTSTGIDDNATNTAITISSGQNVSFNDDTGNTAKMVWNATDESLKINAQYGDYYVAYPVPQLHVGGVTSDLVLIIGEKDVNQVRIVGRFFTPTPYPLNTNRNAFSVDIMYQQWNSQLPKFTYDAMHTGAAANAADNMELGEVVYNSKTYYAIKIQANVSSLGGQPIYFTGGITNTTDLGWVVESALTSFTAVTPSSLESSDKRISAENIRFKNEKNEDKMLITSGGDISFYEDTGTTPTFFWDASAESLGIGTTSIPYITSNRSVLGINGSTDSLFAMQRGGGNNFYVHNNATQTAFVNTSALPLTFSTNSVERMRIDPSGTVNINTSADYSSIAKLVVYDDVFDGDVALLIKNDRYNNSGATATLKFEQRTHSQQGNAGKIVSRRMGNYNETSGSKASALDFYTAQSATDNLRMSILYNGNVGIGTNAPNSRLEVLDSSATGIISRSTATQATDSNKGLRVRNNSDTDTFAVSYKGNVFLGSGTGIYFDGSTSSNNALDDYEEGTWTPTINVGTYTLSAAKYLKIGNQVTLWVNFIQFANTTDPSQINITGLPYSVASGWASTAVGTVMVRNTGNPVHTIYIGSGSSLSFYKSESGAFVGLKYSDLNSTGNEMYFVATYKTT